jgi:putative endonuclease
MPKTHLEFGKLGEETASDFLKASGYKIIVKNYKTKFGEIDIIAKEKDTLVFIEVKTRHTDEFGGPLAAVNKFKQNQISKAALTFLKEKNFLEKRARFDIVSIVYKDATPQINLIKNAFELDNKYIY